MNETHPNKEVAEMRAIIILTIAVLAAALVSTVASAADMSVMRDFHRVVAAQEMAREVLPGGNLHSELVQLTNAEVRSVAVNFPEGNTIVWDQGPLSGDLVIVGEEPGGAVFVAIVDGPCIDPLWSNEGPYAVAKIGHDTLLRYRCP